MIGASSSPTSAKLSVPKYASVRMSASDPVTACHDHWVAEPDLANVTAPATISSAAASQLVYAPMLLTTLPTDSPRTLSHADSHSRPSDTDSANQRSSPSVALETVNATAPVRKISSEGRYVRFETQ